LSRPRGLPGSRVCPTSRGGSTAVRVARPSSTRCSLVGMVGGTVLSVVEANPIGLLVLSAVVNGIAAGPFLIVVMLISRDGRLMGRYRNGRLAATLGWTTTAITLVAGAVGFWLTVTGS